VKGDEADGVCDACGMQQHALNDAEDGGVCTNAEGQGENGDDREERGVKMTEQGLAEIGQQHAHLSTHEGLRRCPMPGSPKVAE
jgi:hypothetical protein